VGHSDAALDRHAVKRPDAQVQVTEAALHHVAVNGKIPELCDSPVPLLKLRLPVASM
jgi:hypothetical protein